MVVLFATEDDDYFQEIEPYLISLKCKYLKIDLDKIQLSDFKLISANNEVNVFLSTSFFDICFSDVSYFFYRSGSLYKKTINLERKSVDYNKVLNSYYEMDQDTLINFIYSEIRKKSLGFINQTPLNKLVQLNTALKVGLNVPNFSVLSDKKSLFEWKQNRSIITKAIQENVFVNLNKKIYYQRVSEVKGDSIPSSFSSTLFQEFVDKTFEIRTFFLDGKFYSIACMSGEKIVDMRDYYESHYYYKVKLPKEIESKLNKLLHILNINCCSIDMLLDNQNNYYFLEINTQGQFDWVSKIGNYNLPQKIASYLNEKDKSKNRFKTSFTSN